MPNYLSDTSYLAIKTEANEGVAERPDIFVPLVSESVRTDPMHTADRRLKGVAWKSDDLLRGSRNHEGDVVVFADPDILAHLFNMTMKIGTSTGGLGTDGFTHPFTVGASKSYTIEMGKGDYAQRYVGVKGENLKLQFVDGKLQAILTIKSMKQFSVGTLSTALTGAGMVTIVLKQQYDLNPTDGLVAGDVLVIEDSGTGLDVDCTIASVAADGITITINAAEITAAINAPVRLKVQTPSYASLQEPFFQGNTLVGVGADEATASASAASKGLAVPFYELTLDKIQNLLSAPASGSMDPIQLLPQTQEAKLSLSRLLEDSEQHRHWLDRVKQAITVIIKGKAIGAGLERFTWKFYNTKLITNEEPLEAGAYIFDKQEFEALMGNTFAIAVEVINRTSSTEFV